MRIETQDVEDERKLMLFPYAASMGANRRRLQKADHGLSDGATNSPNEL
jgi:hypothetical protein